MTVEVLPLKPGALQCCGPGRIFRMWAFMLRHQSFFAPRLPVWREFLRWPRQLWCPGLPVSRSGTSCCRTSEKSLVACCRESDSWCLRNAKDRRLQPKRHREVSREPRPLPAPETPATVPALLRVLERHVDRLANDLQRTTTFFANRQRLLDSRLSQICLQLDAIREQVFVQPTAVPLQPNLREVFDLNCPPHVAEQASKTLPCCSGRLGTMSRAWTPSLTSWMKCRLPCADVDVNRQLGLRQRFRSRS